MHLKTLLMMSLVHPKSAWSPIAISVAVPCASAHLGAGTTETQEVVAVEIAAIGALKVSLNFEIADANKSALRLSSSCWKHRQKPCAVCLDQRASIASRGKSICLSTRIVSLAEAPLHGKQVSILLRPHRPGVASTHTSAVCCLRATGP